MLLGHFNLGLIFLIMFDVYTLYTISTTTVETTIKVLCHIFAVYGLPEQVMTDNGPQLTA